jgi:hypothetical protein
LDAAPNAEVFVAKGNTVTQSKATAEFEKELGSIPSPVSERVRRVLKQNERPLRITGEQKGKTMSEEMNKPNGNGETTPSPTRKAAVRAVDIMPEADVYKAADFEGKDITVTHIKFLHGEFGEFVSLEIEAEIDGSPVMGNLINSGTVVQDKLRRLMPTVNAGQPIIMKFVMNQSGKRAFWDIE